MTVVKVAAVEVSEGSGAKGPWKRYLLTDGNGQKCSTFDEILGKTAQNLTGKEAEIEVEVKGNFTNLKAIKPYEPPAQAVKQLERAPREAKKIIRQVCIKAGAEIVAAQIAISGKVQSPKLAAEMATSLAEHFELWINRDDAPTVVAEEDIPF